MVAAKNAMEIFSVLDKSNCRKCGEKTCLAFAGAVYLGKRRIQECPHLDNSVIEKILEKSGREKRPLDDQDEYISSLVNEVVDLDFAVTAERIGALDKSTVLTVTVLGKKIWN